MFPNVVTSVRHHKLIITAVMAFVGSLFPLKESAVMARQIQEPEYQLVWSDEFDTNGLPNPDNWHFQTQWIIPGVGWANDEQQHYTDRIDNAVIEDGVLKIIAKKETFTDSQGTRDYTSARLNSKFAFTYGKVVVRAKLPAGIGTWPAIWMLGTNINETGGFWNNGVNKVPWPLTGEIDIMEQFGSEKQSVHGTVHHAQEFGGTTNSASLSAPTATSAFHDYTIIWNKDEIQFLVDDVLYYTYNPETKYPLIGRNINTWPFFEPQYLLLNVAMGGTLGGTIDPNFTESAMEIDYVRVYQQATIDEKDASLSALYVNGTLLHGFESDKLNYSYEVPSGASMIPVVTYDKSVEGATVEIFNAVEIPGTTTVQVTAVDGAARRSYSVKFIGDPILGITNESMKVFPNPSSNSIHISLPKEASGIRPNDLRFIDIGGVEQTVSVKKIGSDLFADIHSLSTGVYFIRFKSYPNKNLRFVKQ